MEFDNVPKKLQGKSTKEMAAGMFEILSKKAKRMKLRGRLEFKLRHDFAENEIHAKLRPIGMKLRSPIPAMFTIACYREQFRSGWMIKLEGKIIV